MEKMKYLSILISMLFIAGTRNTNAQADSDSVVHVDADTVQADSLEHRLIVFDPGYESFLATRPSKEHYSKSYYSSWNKMYVSEWNNRYRSGSNPDLYENEINYDMHMDYPLEIEYQLYYFFQFFEDKYNVILVPRGKNR